MKITSRIAALILGTVVLLSGVVSSAWAQSVPGLMFPPFNPGQSCYVARPVVNVTCGDLDSRLKQIVSGLRINSTQVQFYEIFVKEPDAGIPQVQGTPPGGVVAETILNTWKSKSAATFPSTTFIALVMTQSKDDPSKWMMAVRWGSGMNQFINFPAVKNILDNNVGTLRAGNYHDYSVNVATEVVRAIGTAVNNTNVRPPQTTQPPVTRPVERPVERPVARPSEPVNIPWIPVIVVLVLLGGGVGAYIVISGKGAKKREYEGLVESTKPVTDNLNTQTDTLVNAYDGLAMGKKTYTSGSESEKQYKAALMTAATYFAHAEALKAHQAKIDEAVAKKDYATAVTLVNATIDITGDELPPELRTATSGKFQKESFTYAQLVSQLGSEFDAANKVFGKLSTSFNTTMSNKKSIEADLSTINTAKTAVVGAGVSFAPFQAEYDEISTGTAAFVKKVIGDPLGAFAESETLKGRVASLKGALETVMELKKTQVAVATTVEEARTKVNNTRGTAVEWKYATGEKDAKFTLAAAGNNPDTALGAADAQLKALSAALEAGKVKEAGEAKAAALAKAKEAGDLVDAVIAAKNEVDAKAAALAATFGDEPGFGFIATAYKAQDFVGAKNAVDTFAEISKLRATRTKVQSSLTEGSRYVTDATDRAFAAASKAVEDVVAQTRVANANWSAVAKTAVEAEKGFDAVVKAIAADAQVFQGAKTAVSGLRSAYETAFTLTGDERCVQGPEGPRGRLAPVNTTLHNLEASVQGNVKQNWTDIAAKAKAAHKTVDAAVEEANAQIAEMDKYAAEMRDVQGRYDSMSGSSYSVRIPRSRQTYTPGVGVDSAPQNAAYRAHMEAAEVYYRQRRLDQYEAELRAARAQQDMMNTWMWFMVWNNMSNSNDAWARQYAHDQGFQQGMDYANYHNHAQSQPSSGDGWYQPTPVNEWTPSQPVSSCGGASSGSNCGSSSSPSSDNTPASCGGSSSGSDSSSSSSSGSSCSSSSSSSCSSSSGSSCSSSSGSSCGSSS